MPPASAAPRAPLPAAAPAPAVEYRPAASELAFKLLPELSVACVALYVALRPTDARDAMLQDVLLTIAFVEGAFCIAQGTLTDLATRLRRPPPWQLALVLSVIAALMLGSNIRGWGDMAGEVGWLALLGIAWSVVERLRELWTMPLASRLEKLRRRALVGGRLELLMLFGALGVGSLLLGSIRDADGNGGAFVQHLMPWMIASFFALAAIDVVRVHRAAFARRPRTLLRIDPLGVEYLAPV